MELLRLARGFALLHAEFASPAFDLFPPTDPTRLPRELLHRLGGPPDLKAINLRWDEGDGSLAGGHWKATLFDFAVNLRIGLERVEFETYALERVSSDTLAEAADQVLELVAGLCGRNPFGTIWADIGVHGTLDGGLDVDGFIRRFVPQPPPLVGDLTGTGCTFYYGPAGDQSSSGVSVERSFSTPGGLMLRKRTAWDATRLTNVAIGARAIAEFEDSARQLGLEIARGEE